MSTSIRLPGPALDLHLPSACSRERELRISSVHVRRSGADEREGYRVRCRVAVVQARRSVIGMARRGVVLVGGQPVMVLGMVVTVVRVRMQQRRETGGRDQRLNEQEHQHTVHAVSL